VENTYTAIAAYWWLFATLKYLDRRRRGMNASVIDSATDERVGADTTTEGYQSILLATERLSWVAVGRHAWVCRAVSQWHASAVITRSAATIRCIELPGRWHERGWSSGWLVRQINWLTLVQVLFGSMACVYVCGHWLQVFYDLHYFGGAIFETRPSANM